MWINDYCAKPVATWVINLICPLQSLTRLLGKICNCLMIPLLLIGSLLALEYCGSTSETGLIYIVIDQLLGCWLHLLRIVTLLLDYEYYGE